MNAVSPLNQSFPFAMRDAASVREAALAVLPEIAARAGVTERDRRVPEANVALRREVGFLRLVQPRAFGGLEGEFADLIDFAIDVGSVCTSTGWVCGLGAAHRWRVATFPLAAQRDVWGADLDAIVFGSYAPAGAVMSTEGGWRPSGRWMFASGCDVAGWALCGTLLPPAAEEGGRPRRSCWCRAPTTPTTTPGTRSHGRHGQQDARARRRVRPGAPGAAVQGRLRRHVAGRRAERQPAVSHAAGELHRAVSRGGGGRGAGRA